MSEYIKEFKKDPFDVSFKVDEMKNGQYLIEGDVSKKHWAEACKRIDVPEAGQCYARLVVEKNSYYMDLETQIECTMERVCVRSLDSFEEKSQLQYKERVFLQAQNEEEEADLLEGDTLDSGDIITQHIILEMNPYPTHPRYKGGKEGEFDVLDGQQDEVDEEKNPFSVLKNLKS